MYILLDNYLWVRVPYSDPPPLYVTTSKFFRKGHMHLSQPHQGTKIKFTTTTLYGASNVTPYNGGENIRQINPAYTIVKIINNIESLTINLKKASFALSNVFFFSCCPCGLLSEIYQFMYNISITYTTCRYSRKVTTIF